MGVAACRMELEQQEQEEQEPLSQPSQQQQQQNTRTTSTAALKPQSHRHQQHQQYAQFQRQQAGAERQQQQQRQQTQQPQQLAATNNSTRPSQQAFDPADSRALVLKMMQVCEGGWVGCCFVAHQHPGVVCAPLICLAALKLL